MLKGSILRSGVADLPYSMLTLRCCLRESCVDPSVINERSRLRRFCKVVLKQIMQLNSPFSNPFLSTLLFTLKHPPYKVYIKKIKTLLMLHNFTAIHKYIKHQAQQQAINRPFYRLENMSSTEVTALSINISSFNKTNG